MKRLEKNFNDINIQLKEEKSKYRKLKICKYSFEISKICIVSVSTGLSIVNVFAIISLIFIPIIDTIKNTSNVDYRLYESKLKKNLLKKFTLRIIELQNSNLY